jgi:V8-like Glu-specific endopeptidase
MKIRPRTNPRRSRAQPPLAAKEFRKASIEVRRHKPVSVPISAATFDIISKASDERPAVTTRIVPAIGTNPRSRWRVEVTLDGGQVVPAITPPFQPKILKLSALKRARKTPLHPSMPDDGSKFVKWPRLLPRRSSFKLRHGDLEYDPTTVFRPDGRKPYSDSRYPWRCLCRVWTTFGGSSGVLIGPRHVLTASHVIDWTARWATVNVLQQGTTFLDSANTAVAYAISIMGPYRLDDSESDEDYAVLVVDKRLGVTYGWYGARTYDSAWDDEVSAWRNIGYPADIGSNIPTYQRDFFLNELAADYGSARLLRSQTFDNFLGQSGGPIFGFWGGGPYVVGVVSGEGPDYNYISGGSALPDLISLARGDFP